jgi:hypothetical protein
MVLYSLPPLSCRPEHPLNLTVQRLVLHPTAAAINHNSPCVSLSCPTGLNILRGFLEPDSAEAAAEAAAANQRTLAALVSPDGTGLGGSGLAKRVIACLDVRSNDAGDPVQSVGGGVGLPGVVVVERGGGAALCTRCLSLVQSSIGDTCTPAHSNKTDRTCQAVAPV